MLRSVLPSVHALQPRAPLPAQPRLPARTPLLRRLPAPRLRRPTAATGSSGEAAAPALQWSVGAASSQPPASSPPQPSRKGSAARPPDDWDHVALFRATSVAYCAAHFPDLVELARDGTLVVVPRAADYVERREDGYREPEVVFLVGTSHLSLQSAADVERVITAVRPQNTVVELCKSRASVMYDVSELGGGSANSNGQNNLMALGGEAGFVQALQRSLRLGGAAPLLLRAALGAVSKRAGMAAGAMPGGEFRAARGAALAVQSQLVLGDRPVEITLAMAWAAASQADRLALASFLAQGLLGRTFPAITQDAIDRLKADDSAVRSLFVMFASKYPALADPLLHSRDAYLAWSLKRSKAVNGTRHVVGVIGRGHLRGVCYALTHEQEALRFAMLIGREDSEGRRVPKSEGVNWPKLAVEAALFAAAAWLWGELTSGGASNALL